MRVFSFLTDFHFFFVSYNHCYNWSEYTKMLQMSLFASKFSWRSPPAKYFQFFSSQSTPMPAKALFVNFSVSKIFNPVKAPVRFFASHWYLAGRAGVKYVLSNTNTNTNTKIWIFQIQIQIQIFYSTLFQIQIQIQIHQFKYKYKYVQPNISAETVRIQNRVIL